ncbi:unnamed protein product [Prorocentrum cordatum]|uniref:Uncharacterized protein n=1 Tax=Prorocentrum cordatum TaxID=2364126 RepID=A0ABN9UE53_9DINO|nr:unnamed protein product [Polarella glacialis]
MPAAPLLRRAAAAGAPRAAGASPLPDGASLRGGLSPAVGSAGEHESDVVVIGSGHGGLAQRGRSRRRRQVGDRAGVPLPRGGCRPHVQGEGQGRGRRVPSVCWGRRRQQERSSSPVKHIYQILGEEPEWIKYDRWNAFIPEGEANAEIGYDEFVSELLPRFGGPDAPAQWRRLMTNIMPLADAIVNGPPPSFVREDAGVLVTLGRYFPKLKMAVLVLPVGGAVVGQPVTNTLWSGSKDPDNRSEYFISAGNEREYKESTYHVHARCGSECGSGCLLFRWIDGWAVHVVEVLESCLHPLLVRVSFIVTVTTTRAKRTTRRDDPEGCGPPSPGLASVHSFRWVTTWVVTSGSLSTIAIVNRSASSAIDLSWATNNCAMARWAPLGRAPALA